MPGVAGMGRIPEVLVLLVIPEPGRSQECQTLPTLGGKNPGAAGGENRKRRRERSGFGKGKIWIGGRKRFQVREGKNLDLSGGEDPNLENEKIRIWRRKISGFGEGKNLEMEKEKSGFGEGNYRDWEEEIIQIWGWKRS